MNCSRVREVASGFVLGALDADETLAVSDHLDSCSKQHPEIDDLGGVLAYLPESLEPVEPPAWLRESVIAAARADLAARRRFSQPAERSAARPVVVPAVASAKGSAEIIPFAAARLSRRRRALTWATRVAAAVAIVALAGYSYVLQGQLADTQRDRDHYINIANVIGQGDTKSATLTGGAGSSAGGLAALRPTGHVIVYLNGLPATKGDQVYSVWLSVNGQWSKLGSFTVDDSGLGYLEVDNVPTTSNLWLWVCREPNAGVAQPTYEDKVVSGTIWY